MAMTLRLATLTGVVLMAAVTAVNAQTDSSPLARCRVAIVTSPEAKDLADPLLPRLQTLPGLDWIERGEIDRTLREQGLRAAGFAQTLRVGQLLRADAILLIDAAGNMSQRRVRATLIRVNPGVLIWARSIRAKPAAAGQPVVPANAAEFEQVITSGLLAGLPKLAAPAGDLQRISIPGLPPKPQGPRTPGAMSGADLCEALREILAQSPTVHVLERTALEVLDREKEWTTGRDDPFWRGSLMLTGSLEGTMADRDAFRLQAVVVGPDGKPGAPIIIEGRRGEEARTARELMSALAPSLRSGSLLPVEADPANEAERMAELAITLSGTLAEPELLDSAVTTAWVLGNRRADIWVLRNQALLRRAMRFRRVIDIGFGLAGDQDVAAALGAASDAFASDPAGALDRAGFVEEACLETVHERDASVKSPKRNVERSRCAAVVHLFASEYLRLALREPQSKARLTDLERVALALDRVADYLYTTGTRVEFEFLENEVRLAGCRTSSAPSLVAAILKALNSLSSLESRQEARKAVLWDSDFGPITPLLAANPGAEALRTRQLLIEGMRKSPLPEDQISALLGKASLPGNNVSASQLFEAVEQAASLALRKKLADAYVGELLAAARRLSPEATRAFCRRHLPRVLGELSTLPPQAGPPGILHHFFQEPESFSETELAEIRKLAAAAEAIHQTGPVATLRYMMERRGWPSWTAAASTPPPGSDAAVGLAVAAPAGTAKVEIAELPSKGNVPTEVWNPPCIAVPNRTAFWLLERPGPFLVCFEPGKGFTERVPIPEGATPEDRVLMRSVWLYAADTQRVILMFEGAASPSRALIYDLKLKTWIRGGPAPMPLHPGLIVEDRLYLPIPEQVHWAAKAKSLFSVDLRDGSVAVEIDYDPRLAYNRLEPAPDGMFRLVGQGISWLWNPAKKSLGVDPGNASGSWPPLVAETPQRNRCWLRRVAGPGGERWSVFAYYEPWGRWVQVPLELPAKPGEPALTVVTVSPAGILLGSKERSRRLIWLDASQIRSYLDANAATLRDAPPLPLPPNVGAIFERGQEIFRQHADGKVESATRIPLEATLMGASPTGNLVEASFSAGGSDRFHLEGSAYVLVPPQGQPRSALPIIGRTPLFHPTLPDVVMRGRGVERVSSSNGSTSTSVAMSGAKYRVVAFLPSRNGTLSVGCPTRDSAPEIVITPGDARDAGRESEVVATLSPGDDPWGLMVAPDSSRFVLINNGRLEIRSMSGGTLEFVDNSPVEFPDRPQQIALWTPDSTGVAWFSPRQRFKGFRLYDCTTKQVQTVAPNQPFDTACGWLPNKKLLARLLPHDMPFPIFVEIDFATGKARNFEALLGKAYQIFLTSPRPPGGEASSPSAHPQ